MMEQNDGNENIQLLLLFKNFHISVHRHLKIIIIFYYTGNVNLFFKTSTQILDMTISEIAVRFLSF